MDLINNWVVSATWSITINITINWKGEIWIESSNENYCGIEGNEETKQDYNVLAKQDIICAEQNQFNIRPGRLKCTGISSRDLYFFITIENSTSELRLTRIYNRLSSFKHIAMWNQRLLLNGNGVKTMNW